MIDNPIADSTAISVIINKEKICPTKQSKIYEDNKINTFKDKKIISIKIRTNKILDWFIKTPKMDIMKTIKYTIK